MQALYLMRMVQKAINKYVGAYAYCGVLSYRANRDDRRSNMLATRATSSNATLYGPMKTAMN
jgi:hypothetical protein